MNGYVIATAGALACAGAVSAAPLAASAEFGVRDNNFDGIGDEFASASLADAIETRFRDQRAHIEYDLSSLAGPTVTSATLTGTFDEQFSFRFGTSPATAEIAIYAGNGASDLGDFSAPATVVLSVTLEDDFDLADFSVDVASAIQALVDAGATHAGVRFRSVTQGVGQFDAINIALNVEAIPAPGVAALAGVAGAFAARRRRA